MITTLITLVHSGYMSMCDIPWYIHGFPRESFIIDISMHFWATLKCGMFGCHGELVSPVRGALDAPSVKSVSYHAVCAEISCSSDVKG